jgi:aldehyde:ferredoxin oxidoreductase
LNGLFPFASKTAIVINNEGVIEDIYLGGNLSLRIRYSGIDAILIFGHSEEKTVLDILNSSVTFRSPDEDSNRLGLPGKRSVLKIDKTKVLLGGYFTTPEYYLEKEFIDRNIFGLVITGTELINITDFDKYEELYKKILQRKDELSVLEGTYPSCSNCPMACGKSKTGEMGGNVLLHSLVACQYADKIYTDVGVVFSCLNILGYEYTHEDIEALPRIIEQTLKRIS